MFLCFFSLLIPSSNQDVVNKNALYRNLVTKLIYKNELKKSITLHSIDMFVIFFKKCLFIQVENLNMIANSAC
jgi:hypothetical protein